MHTYYAVVSAFLSNSWSLLIRQCANLFVSE